MWKAWMITISYGFQYFLYVSFFEILKLCSFLGAFLGCAGKFGCWDPDVGLVPGSMTLTACLVAQTCGAGTIWWILRGGILFWRIIVGEPRHCSKTLARLCDCSVVALWRNGVQCLPFALCLGRVAQAVGGQRSREAVWWFLRSALPEVVGRGRIVASLLFLG